MVIESLKVMLFGMAGIFFVMGLVIACVFVLNLFAKNEKSDDE